MTTQEMVFNLIDKYLWQAVASGLAIIIAWRGLSIMTEQIKERGVGRYNLQALGIFVLLPAVLLLGVSKAIDGQVLSALIGTIAGYLFGAKVTEKDASMTERNASN